MQDPDNLKDWWQRKKRPPHNFTGRIPTVEEIAGLPNKRGYDSYHFEGRPLGDCQVEPADFGRLERISDTDKWGR